MSYIIPQKFYIGYQERVSRNWKLPFENSAKIKLGFATYFEDNAKYENRKDTIDRWAEPYDTEYVDRKLITHPRDDLKSEIILNEPQVGFKLSDFVKRTGWSGNVVWRIQDPRGFELEISSGNLQQLLDMCTITNGIIESPCVYAWSMKGSKVCLIPTNSDLYIEAELDTNRRDLPIIKTSQLNPGELVAFKNSKVGVYWGQLYNYSHNTEFNGNYILQPVRKHLFQIVTVNPADNSIITTGWEWILSPKVVEIKGTVFDHTSISLADTINLKLRDQILHKKTHPDILWGTDFVSSTQISLKDPIVTFEPINIKNLNYNNVIKRNIHTDELEYIYVENVYSSPPTIRYVVHGSKTSDIGLNSIQYLSQLTVSDRISYNNMQNITNLEDYEFYIPCVTVNNINVPVSRICVA